ncbi:O-antigen ligase family protein [Oscillatoriales cyanobacterium LEGE 11467]|uniref:O-antigen ligase family protein n=1 Tax=Zarconia navalis LEGE 11467 TaxID=1828826 RepID=A0A928ZAG1_9CYAN|nr:O-antigen ligase family protein [Zarconia navalis]MBE9041666.1 O-antigen ligase family protein [Zarconia navalis LEGE 11467]
MKALLADPIFLSLILGIGLVFILLAFQYASPKNVTDRLAVGLSVAILVVIPYLTIKPFVWLHPSDFMLHNLSLNSALMKIVSYGVSVFVLKFWFRDFARSFLLLFANPFLGILLGLVGFSAFWSELPLLTLQASLALLVVSTLAAHIAQKYTWQQIATLLRWSTGIITGLSLFYSLAIPSVGVVGKGWRGILAHPNPLGALMGLNAVFWYVRAANNPKERVPSVLMVLVSMLIMQNTNSAGAKVTLVALFSALLILRFIKRLSFQWAYAIIVIFMAISIGTTILVTENLEYIVVDVLGKDMTLTGRVPLWTKVIGKVVRDSPILGFGFHGFWQDWRGEDNPAYEVASDGYGWVAHHAHNGFIDLFADLGMVGLFLFVASLMLNIGLAIKYMSQTREPEAIFYLIIFILLLIVNNTQSSLLGIHHIWFYYVLCSVRLGMDTLGHKSRRLERKEVW